MCLCAACCVLCVWCGLAQVYIRQDIGFGSNQVTAYLTGWGLSCYFSGRYLVKWMVRRHRANMHWH